MNPKAIPFVFVGILFIVLLTYSCTFLPVGSTVCSPGEVELCDCSGTKGTRICIADGSGYGVCLCNQQNCTTDQDCSAPRICQTGTCQIDPDWSPGVSEEHHKKFETLNESGAGGKLPWGAVVGEFCGIKAYSNANNLASKCDYGNARTNGLNGGKYGYEYQCVEFAYRFICTVYDAQLGCKESGKQGRKYGNAWAWFTNDANHPVLSEEKWERFPSGQTKTLPRRGDLLVFGKACIPGTGHIAVVRNVGEDFVEIIEQNFACSPQDGNRRIRLKRNNGVLSIDCALGWMRVKNAPEACPKQNSLPCQSQICSPKEIRCSTDAKAVEICDDNGCAWEIQTHCGNDKYCQDGECKSSSSCGNRRCDNSENCSSCPQDCRCSGNQVCEAGRCTTPNPCGNSRCDNGETCSSCPQDCRCLNGNICKDGRCQSSSLCGNGSCDSSENCSACPQDCGCSGNQICEAGRCTPPNPCGNGRCDSGETCSSCSQDCSCPSGQFCQSGVCQQNCSPNAYKQCYNGDLYNYDSCGQRGNLAERCQSGCSGNRCKTCTPTTSCVNSGTRNPSSTEAQGGGLVMSLRTTSTSSCNALTLEVTKRDGSLLGPGTYRLRVGSCRTFGFERNKTTISSSRSSLTFTTAHGGSAGERKEFCVTKDDGGSTAWWWSNFAIVTMQQTSCP